MTKLEKVYDQFWKNIYYNDAYVFYKNAIEYYKNVHNNNMHGAFSIFINKKLYTGSCQYIKKTRRRDFSDHLPKIDFMLCYVMLGYARLCYVWLGYVMLGYAMFG